MSDLGCLSVFEHELFLGQPVRSPGIWIDLIQALKP